MQSRDCANSQFAWNIYMLTTAVLLTGSCTYLGGSDAGHPGSSLSDHCKTMGVVPLNSRPVAHYGKGGTTPHLKLS